MTPELIQSAILGAVSFIALGIVNLKVSVGKILTHIEKLEESFNEHKEHDNEKFSEIKTEIKELWAEAK